MHLLLLTASFELCLKPVTLKCPSLPLHAQNLTSGRTAEAAALLIIRRKSRREKEPLELKCIPYLHIPVTQVSTIPERLKSLTFSREALPLWLPLYKTSWVWEGACSCQGRTKATVHVLPWPRVADASQVSAVTALFVYFTFIFFTRGESCPCLSAAGW